MELSRGVEESTPPRISSLEFFSIFQNSYSNIFERLHLRNRKTSRRLSQTILREAVRGGVFSLVKIKAKYTTTDSFQGIFLNFSEQLFQNFWVTSSVIRKDSYLFFLWTFQCFQCFTLKVQAFKMF